MANLTPVIDPSGQMTQEQINASNINNLMQESNKTSEILGNNQLTLFTDGTTNRYLIGYVTNGWGVGDNVGIKISQPGIDVTAATDTQLLYKNDFNSEENYNNSGQLIYKNNFTTQFWYNATTGKNVMQAGLLPDGTYGWAVAAAGYNVSDGFS